MAYDQICVFYFWEGGECPVAPNTKVKVWFENNDKACGFIEQASELDWDADGVNFAKIIAFEVVEFPQPIKRKARAD